MNRGFRLSNQGIEVYKKRVSYESEENITELQIGVIAQKIGCHSKWLSLFSRIPEEVCL